MNSVSVQVPARLHLGFLDLNGSLGRKYGSIGVAINGPRTRITLRRAAQPSVTGPESLRATLYLERMIEKLGFHEALALSIDEAIPAHAGLGSGTQLALAIAAAVRTLMGLQPDPRGDAEALDRGARSGIGIGLFTGGGVVLDGGRKTGGKPPPVLAQVSFPDAWRIILIHDHATQGMNGAAEVQAFADLPAFPEAEAAHLCRLVLMQAWPALIEKDIEGFGAAISELQQRLGNHFAPAQGGRYTSRAIADVAAMLESAGAHGCGQSSWGPTGFAFAASREDAERLLRIVGKPAAERGLKIETVTGNNEGAVITPGRD